MSCKRGTGPILSLTNWDHCAYCMVALVRDQWQMNQRTTDHILPVSRGGINGPKVIACLRCNSFKSGYTLSEWQNVVTFRLLNVHLRKKGESDDMLKAISKNIDRLKKYLVSRYGGDAYMRLEDLWTAQIGEAP